MYQLYINKVFKCTNLIKPNSVGEDFYNFLSTFLHGSVDESEYVPEISFNTIDYFILGSYLEKKIEI